MIYSNIGDLLVKARKEKGMTQKAIAKQLNVSEQAVSKWERGTGCPDVRLLNALSDILDIDAKVLLSGIAVCNTNDKGNMKNTNFYVCRECSNVLTSTGKAEISCCGKRLQALKKHKDEEKHKDEVNHKIVIDTIDDELYVHIDKHPMSKEDYISFICYITSDKINLIKLYPEQNCEVRFHNLGHGIIYIYSNLHGLCYREV